ncbi:MAG: hypothetical protein WA894_09885, partial [Candidatus Acidiferrum sp.]
ASENGQLKILILDDQDFLSGHEMTEPLRFLANGKDCNLPRKRKGDPFPPSMRSAGRYYQTDREAGQRDSPKE